MPRRWRASPSNGRPSLARPRSTSSDSAPHPTTARAAPCSRSPREPRAALPRGATRRGQACPSEGSSRRTGGDGSRRPPSGLRSPPLRRATRRRPLLESAPVPLLRFDDAPPCATESLACLCAPLPLAFEHPAAGEVQRSLVAPFAFIPLVCRGGVQRNLYPAQQVLCP